MPVLLEKVPIPHTIPSEIKLLDMKMLLLFCSVRMDRLRLSNSNDFARTAERYLNRVSARYGSSNVYVIAGIDTLSDPRPLTMEQENNVLQSLCRQHGWWFASAYAAFRTVGRSTGMPQHALYTDGIHPNRIGQVVLRRSLEQLLGL